MDGNDLVGVTRFDTDAFAPQHRHEAWVNQHWPAIGVLFDSHPAGDFWNRSMRVALGAVTVHCSTIAGQDYARSAADVRRDDFDHLLIPITLTGSQQGDANGRAFSVARGGLSFVDLTLPETHRSSASRTIMLSVPRALAEQGGHHVRDLHGRTVAAPAAALLRRHVCGVARMLPRLTLAQAASLERITTDLVTATLAIAGIERAVDARVRDTAQHAAARALIADRLESPVLTVGWLARRLRVSRSALYRLFEDDGGVLAYIRRQRLIRVRDGLSRPGRRLRIADYADHWGFSDTAHLSRQFRQEFGLSPSDYREQQQRHHGAGE
jgi:AraC-like DNA-binding protein